MDERAEIACAAFVARSQEINDECASWPDGYDGYEREELRDLMAAALAAADAVGASEEDTELIAYLAEGVAAFGSASQVSIDTGDVVRLLELARRGMGRAVPDGWVLVPKEPTEAMLDAYGSTIVGQRAWADMLGAAPKPETQE